MNKIKMPTTKDVILAYIETRQGGATYASMIYTLGLHRTTLRRWIMELEQDREIERLGKKHNHGRAVFVARRNILERE